MNIHQVAVAIFATACEETRALNWLKAQETCAQLLFECSTDWTGPVCLALARRSFSVARLHSARAR